MSNDIYSYIKENFGIEITDYQFKRDYIKEPLKRSEKPYKEDLKYLYITLNIRRKDIGILLNIGEGTIKLYIKYYKIKKPYKLRMDNHYKTLEKLYGVNHNSKLKSTLEKRVESSLKHFGTEYPNQSEIIKNKIKETCFKKYGEHNPTLIGSNEFKNKMLDKYGVESYTQTSMFKNLFKDRNFCDKWLEKINNTKKEHNSFNKSKDEDIIYELLIQKYPNIIRQYKNDLYPYFCDFYIPELDLYIEYNGHWTHGFEPYIGTEEQNKKINLWESKNNGFYKQAIYVWTELDVQKRQTFEKNNLNYLIFYDIIEVEKWIKGLL